MNLFFLLVMVFILNALVTRLCVLNFLKIAKKKYPYIYKKFGSLSTADMYPGRDIIGIWYILKNKVEQRELKTLKYILIISTVINVAFFVLIFYLYILAIFS